MPTILRIAASSADRHITQVALPAREALQLAILITAVMTVFALGGWNLTRL